MENLHNLVIAGIDLVGMSFEVLGVVVILIGVAHALVRYAASVGKPQTGPTSSYRLLRNSIGRTLLLGLEILVAADIVLTVAVDPSFNSVGILALLVLVRVFLSWTLTLEIEERWPWTPRSKPAHETTDA